MGSCTGAMHGALARLSILGRGRIYSQYGQLRVQSAGRIGRSQLMYNSRDRGFSTSRCFASTSSPHDTKDTTPSTGISDTVRKYMRHVAHPVAIVTASPRGDKGPVANPRHWRGATVSSFVTVAMDPDPVVCFNIKRDSSTFAALASSSRFNVHVLSSSPVAEAVATKFAGGNALEPFHDGEGNLEWWVDEPTSEHGDHPVIGREENELDEAAKSEGLVLFRLGCSYIQDKTVDVGDHVVVFGKVTGTSPQLQGELSADCLLYVDGRYSRASAR